MRRSVLLFVILLMLLCPLATPVQQVSAREPVLEEYRIVHGGTLGGPTSGLHASLFDRYFANGDAKASMIFETKKDEASLRLKVWRTVPEGHTSFALLVFRVEVRGYDSGESVVYSKNLEGFTFGDSQSGRWWTKLDGLPPAIRKMTVTFIGNYE